MRADSSHIISLPRQPWLLGSPIRQLRLAAGLVLLTYVTTHLLDHATLNISIAAADRVLMLQRFLWQGIAGTLLLYAALTVHPLLGLWALYARRHFRWTAAEAWQLLLGLSIPALLANHVTVTRLPYTLYGINKGYIAELDSLYIQGLGPHAFWGWVQLAVLVVAWAHGCLGLYFLLRLRRWFAAWKAPLLTAAVLLPVLALLGFAAGGRELARAMADPAFVALNLAPAQLGLAAQKAHLAAIRNWFLLAYATAILLVIAARIVRRLIELRRGLVNIRYPGGRRVRISPGLSVLDASRLHTIPHASVCGGKGRCSTCRVRVQWSEAPLPAPAAHERQVLEAIGADPAHIRLACQLQPRGDLGVVPLIPPEVAEEFVLGRARRIPGDERFLAVMFVDLRGSSALAARHMPFDSVFLVGRFITAVTRSVADCGGRPVQFLGDGLLALFGLDTPPERACRQALAAVDAVAAGLEGLASLFGQETGQELRYGIGLHCGRAIVGEIGFAQHMAFTALGDTVNTAHALQDLARDMDVAAVISDEVFSVAGADAAKFAAIEAALRGRLAKLLARAVEAAPYKAQAETPGLTNVTGPARGVTENSINRDHESAT